MMIVAPEFPLDRLVVFAVALEPGLGFARLLALCSEIVHLVRRQIAVVAIGPALGTEIGFVLVVFALGLGLDFAPNFPFAVVAGFVVGPDFDFDFVADFADFVVAVASNIRG